MAIYLGIDGGGSKTSWAIGDESSVLGTGATGPSNFVRVGGERARESLASAIDQACAAARIAPAQIRRTCIGMAGAARQEINEWAHRTASELVGGEIEIVGDMIAAFESAFGGGPGVIVIAGTGSIAYGRNSQGETARAGGWGFAISDEGSGHWIGRAAIGAALRSQDAGTGTMLLENILRAWTLSTREQLVLMGNGTPPPDFATLFPVVVQTLEAGDRVAKEVLARAAQELAQLAEVILHKIFSGETAQVAMSGGVFRYSSLVRGDFYNEVRLANPRANIHPVIVDPVQGALAQARRG